jgi:hypothetical protein
MLRTALCVAPLVKVPNLYVETRLDRSSEHSTRRARQRRASALLRALRRVPPCAAPRAAPNRFSERAEPLTTSSTGC